jgi:hypothetical protein
MSLPSQPRVYGDKHLFCVVSLVDEALLAQSPVLGQ